MRQTSFADLDYDHKKRQTRRERFLAEMEKAVPWALLQEQLAPHYPTSGRRGRQPLPLLAMLRIHCMQQWFSFSDRQMEDALYEIESVRRFADFAGVTDALPDETTILNFRHFLEDNGLTTVLLETINAHLKANGLLVSKGTMVDATIIHAPSSTKNQDKTRDPDMHSTQKGNQWYFGMKIHIGADVNSGAVHSVTVTSANTADITELPNLLRKDDEVVFGDAGYTSDEYKRGARHLGMRWCVNDYPQGALETETEQEPVVQTEKAQPQTIGGAGAGRTHFPHHQMPVRFPQDPLPWLGEERLAGQLAGRLSEPVPAQEAIGRRLGINPPKVGGKPDKPPETARQMAC